MKRINEGWATCPHCKKNTYRWHLHYVIDQGWVNGRCMSCKFIATHWLPRPDTIRERS